MQHRPPEYKPGARGVAVGVHRCHRGLREPPLPRRRFSTKSSIALAKGVKRDRITWLSLPAIPEEPKNLFLELTGSRVSFPLYQKGEEGLAVMGLRKAATLLGSLGNVSKGCARGRDRCSAPFASVSPEVVTCHTFAQADVPDAQGQWAKQANHVPCLLAKTPGDAASVTLRTHIAPSESRSASHDRQRSNKKTAASPICPLPAHAAEARLGKRG